MCQYSLFFETGFLIKAKLIDSARLTSLVFCFPSAYVTHVPARLAFPIDSVDRNSTCYACVAVTLLTEPASQLQSSIAMKGTALAPTVSVSLLALSWHLCHDLKRRVCGRWETPGRPASAVMSYHRNPCGLILISLPALVSFPIFYSQPTSLTGRSAV